MRLCVGYHCVLTHFKVFNTGGTIHFYFKAAIKHRNCDKSVFPKSTTMQSLLGTLNMQTLNMQTLTHNILTKKNFIKGSWKERSFCLFALVKMANLQNWLLKHTVLYHCLNSSSCISMIAFLQTDLVRLIS